MDNNIWRDIPHSLKYQINTLGEVRRKTKKGFRNIKIYIKDNYCTVRVDLKGKFKEIRVHQLLAAAFNVIPKLGEVLYFKNKIHTDCFLSNIGTISKVEIGKLTGFRAKAKQVVKLNKKGEIIEVYRSARECAKHNYISYTAISNRCNNEKLKDLDGFVYKWDEDINY